MTGQGAYRIEALVLRKTKLKESDLIVTLLAEDGSLVRAVAHGARKPQSPFASRLEPCAVVDVLLARGRSLDVAKEARFVAPISTFPPPHCPLSSLRARLPRWGWKTRVCSSASSPRLRLWTKQRPGRSAQRTRSLWAAQTARASCAPPACSKS